MSESSVTTDSVLLSAAAAPWLKSGYRIESQAEGVMVLVAPKIKFGWVGLSILSFLTFGIVFVLWMGALMIPRVNRKTLTVVDGVVVTTSSWRTH